MNRSLKEWGALMAVAGALLLAAVVFLICLVLGLDPAVIAILMLVAAALGGWYGWRLTKGAAPSQRRSDSGHGAGRR